MSGINFNKPAEDILENREKRFLSTIEFLKRIDLEEIVEDQNKKSEFIQKITFDEFKDFLLRINGLQRNTPTSKRVFNAGEDASNIVNLKDENGEIKYCPPSNSDKIMLLEDSFEALKRMDRENRNIDSALMVGCAINAIHPFMDGNGRTARSISMILGSSKEKFIAPQVNPEAIQPFIESYLYNLHNFESLDMATISSSEIKFPTMSETDKREFVNAIHEDLSNFLNACQIFTKKKNEPFKRLVISSENNMLSLESFLLKYGNQIDEVMETYREFKNEYVRTLIDIFEHPSNYYIKDIPNIFNRLPLSEQKNFSNIKLIDIFYSDMNKDVIESNEFSWDYLIKFIKGEIE